MGVQEQGLMTDTLLNPEKKTGQGGEEKTKKREETQHPSTSRSRTAYLPALYPLNHSLGVPPSPLYGFAL